MSSEPPPKPIAPGNHAVAWNDPPLFSVGVNTTARAPTKKLTARVGFPINGNASQSQAIGGYNSGSVSLPPTLNSNPNPSTPAFPMNMNYSTIDPAVTSNLGEANLTDLSANPGIYVPS